MEQITVKDLADFCEGKLLCGDPDQIVSDIVLDSRAKGENLLFVPIIGEKVDAHRFIDQAIGNGAVCVLTSEHTEMNREQAFIAVENTVWALQKIGVGCRGRLKIPFVGITGSVGKTTTREMIAAALSAGFKTFKTPGNFNSQVGVPITISSIASTDEIAVLELGMSEPGELTKIAKIAQIQTAVITNIGITHIEQLGSQENIYKEKMTIQDGLSVGGTLVLNGDDPMLAITKAKEGCRTVYYGTGDNADYRAENVHLVDGYPEFIMVHGETKIPVKLQVMGAHQVLNACAALACADHYGVDLFAAAEKLQEFGGFKNRQQLYQVNGYTILDDTYNASPVSMSAAIDILDSMNCTGRRIAVLADMKELGPDAVKFHREVGEHVALKKVDLLLTVGSLAEELRLSASGKNPNLQTVAVENNEALKQYLEKNLKEGDICLLKGSNSMNLGEVARYVCQLHH